MAILIVLVLAVAWAAVLLPPILRARTEGGRGSVGDFMHRLSALSRANGTSTYYGPEPLSPIMPPLHRSGMPQVRYPGAMTAVQKRRRDVLMTLAGAVGFTFLVALVANSIAIWFFQLLVDGLLVAYVFKLLQIKARRRGQHMYRRPIAEPAASPARLATVTPLHPLVDQPQLTLRRSASV